jgi:hypothetical protein
LARFLLTTCGDPPSAPYRVEALLAYNARRNRPIDGTALVRRCTFTDIQWITIYWPSPHMD